MNAEKEAVTAEDHDVQLSRATGVTYGTPIDFLQTRQQRVANAVV